MFKNLSGFFMATAVCVLLVAGSVSAATTSDFDTGYFWGNAGGGTEIKLTGSYSYKSVLSQPWVLYVATIQSQGDYGICFYPVWVSGSTLTYHMQSHIWCNTTGLREVYFNSSEVRIGTYELAARIDDAYYLGAFRATGWWSADRATSK